MGSDLAVRCYHCGDEVPPAGVVHRVEFAGALREFCCPGCLAACQIIHAAGEEVYYDHRSNAAGQIKAGDPHASRSNFRHFDISDILNEYTRELGDSKREIILQIEGIHCQSCVVLNERLLKRLPGVDEVSVLYESGRARIQFDSSQTPLSTILNQIYSIGYRARPIKPGGRMQILRGEGRSFLWRIALAAFASGNIMTLSIALWSGYFSDSMSEEFRRLFQWMELLLVTPVFLYSANVFHRGWKSFIKTGLPGMDVLISAGISAAYFYSVFAFLTRTGEVYFDSVSTIVFFLLVGRYLEWRARLRQRERMESLFKPLPDSAMRLVSFQNTQPQLEEVPIKNLASGDLIWLESGETLCADGTLLDYRQHASMPIATEKAALDEPVSFRQTASEKGSTMLCEMDEAILTGESKPVARYQGDRMLAGSVLVEGRALVCIHGKAEESSMAALSRLTAGVEEGVSRYESFTRALIPYFSAAVLLIAGGAFCYHVFILGASIADSLVVAIAVLIVSCPCALALSVPTATSSALFLGVRCGLLLRDGQVLHALTRLNSFLFDKTGTLTCGRPVVHGHRLFAPTTEVMQLILQMEAGSRHPVGEALQEFARQKIRLESSTANFQDPSSGAGSASSRVVRHISGRGIEWQLEQGTLRLGALSFLQGVDLETDTLQAFLGDHAGDTMVGLARDQELLAIFALQDVPRAESAQVVRNLRKRKYRIGMLTGDNVDSALKIARQIGIKDQEIQAELLPEQKLQVVDTAHKNSTLKPQAAQEFCMVGDGYNDAPALAAARVSIVLARGVPLSLDQAGVILLNNNLMDIFTALGIARAAMRTVKLNLVFSLLYNIVMISIAASGLLLPIWCALAMALSSLTVVLSSATLRIRRASLYREYR